MYLICSTAAFKARNNRISDQNHSKTVQNAARFLESDIFAHSVIAVSGFIRTKNENLVYSPSRVTSESVGKRFWSVVRDRSDT